MQVLGWVTTVLGVVVLVMTARDVFRTLWHPSGQGRLTRLFARGVWRLAGRHSGGARVAAGPLALLAVVVTWAAGFIVGWALIYLPHLPDSFVYGSGIEVDHRGELVDALYLSAVALSTLGLGDIVPEVMWLRPLVAVEALMGFGLLSASVSWLLQIAPALTRRRALAVHLATSRRANGAEHGRAVPATELLLIARDIAMIRVDLHQFDETYYFRERDTVATLAGSLGYAAELADRAREGSDDQRAAGAVLAAALEDLAALVGDRYVGTHGTTEEIFRRYARDQGLDVD